MRIMRLGAFAAALVVIGEPGVVYDQLEARFGNDGDFPFERMVDGARKVSAALSK
jgi:hypothetical protein